MTLRKLVAAILIIFGFHAVVMAENNPADKIVNPAGKIYNPATQINNPASNIYNPASRMDNPNPISPPSQPVSHPTVTESITTIKPVEQIKEQPLATIPQKNYYFKTVKAYITAAKKAFNQDDYVEFLSITEDALRRIGAGTLNASKNTKRVLKKYQAFGYGLLKIDEE